ncbi:ergothioneine biosynthesis glutamate--cysteine ligase EgtA [Streptomyces sp. ODS28]|uniref:ergothioneine biosynthesis glutamate--cysteine ligase EgtA n=1 Tax=Streptomyces sp. ODS28 TaxID=3136688 RepID=UPI0031F13018
MGAPLKESEVAAHVSGICFKTGPPRRTGVELEWLVRDRGRPALAVPARRLHEALAPLREPGALPGGSRVTQEPGGQVELSSLPADTPARCAAAMAADAERLRQTLARAGLIPDGSGLDAHRLPPRILDHPRYRAMETYFDREGPWGRMMMRATASVQINIDAGDESEGPLGYRARWNMAHRLGPVLIAAFANSPLWNGRPTGWASTRQAVWSHMDPSRVRPPEPGGGPRDSWARHALDAPLLCVRGEGPGPWTVPRGLTLRDWLRDGGNGAGSLNGAGRPPDLEDVDYHLSTLFPPVRPRGWLELRMVDAQHGDDWQVPLLVTAALLDDPVASAAARAATEPLAPGREFAPWPVWLRAARAGPADPEVGRAVRACFAAAQEALARQAAPAGAREAVAAFAERYALRGRCPADDRLDALRENGGNGGSSGNSGNSSNTAPHRGEYAGTASPPDVFPPAPPAHHRPVPPVSPASSIPESADLVEGAP